MQELTKQRELSDKQIQSSHDEVNYYKQKCERVEQDLNESRQTLNSFREQEMQSKRQNEEQSDAQISKLNNEVNTLKREKQNLMLASNNQNGLQSEMNERLN